MYTKSSQTTVKQKLSVGNSKNLVKNEEKTVSNSLLTNNHVNRPNTNLIDYISTGDFSKVEEIIQDQISSDQKSYNSDITISLNNLESNLSEFYTAHTKLLKSLGAINELLNYAKGKDYFIKGFNSVKFEISESNNNSILLVLEQLKDNLSENEYDILMGHIAKSLNYNNTKNIDQIIPQKTEEVNLINMFSKNDEEDINKPILIDSTTDKLNNESEMFDIKKHFMVDDDNIEVNEKEKNDSSDKDVLIGQTGMPEENKQDQLEDHTEGITANMDIDVANNTESLTEEILPINNSTEVIENDELPEITSDSLESFQTETITKQNEGNTMEIDTTEDVNIDNIEPVNLKSTNSFSNFESIEDFDFEEEVEEEEENNNSSIVNITENEDENDKKEVLEKFNFNIV